MTSGWSSSKTAASPNCAVQDPSSGRQRQAARHCGKDTAVPRPDTQGSQISLVTQTPLHSPRSDQAVAIDEEDIVLESAVDDIEIDAERDREAWVQGQADLAVRSEGGGEGGRETRAGNGGADKVDVGADAGPVQRHAREEGACG